MINTNSTEIVPVPGSAPQGVKRDEKAAAEFLATGNFNREELDKEFDALPKMPDGATFRQSNRFPGHNRYGNVKCIDFSRVYIDRQTPSDIDYINANWISLRASKSARFIATQCPLPCTVTQFYKMIRQKKVKAIINITSKAEIEKKRSFQYWADRDNVTLQTSDQQRIKRISAEWKPEMKTEVIHIEHKINNDDREPHTVNIFRFDAWPDFGVPQGLDSLALMRLLVEVRKVNQDDNGSVLPPVVIHCSAGLGRTGTVIAIEDGIRALSKGLLPNTREIVENIRRQRPMSVQTKRQYTFIPAVLAQYANSLLNNTKADQVKKIYADLVPAKEEQKAQPQAHSQAQLQPQAQAQPPQPLPTRK